MRSFAEALKKQFSSEEIKNNFRLAQLWNNWSEVVGSKLADLIRPLGHKQHTLILGADDSIVIQEMNFFAPQILERVNDFLDQPFFDKIRFELIKGRTPLDQQLVITPVRQRSLKKPQNLGKLLDKLPKDSPVYKCYKKYISMFEV
ncbi:DUF721 domain-containing protein [Desulfohalobiaceae bacterium Ax17]|uniref:DUF721 domain-containing protein n=1 Tax=Desulfovulcanus ferrireducens TaxID=2831190 RepID=UPI00207BA0F3|nr:DUF721 domain-containing protein [Desulfovulcanus ferrireducens]MBT8764460.1 DUF721 domain-containing protein [Desulfovulcanus ferrireducens]